MIIGVQAFLEEEEMGLNFGSYEKVWMIVPVTTWRVQPFEVRLCESLSPPPSIPPAPAATLSNKLGRGKFTVVDHSQLFDAVISLPYLPVSVCPRSNLHLLPFAQAHKVFKGSEALGLMHSRAGVTVETLVSLKEALKLVVNENVNVDLSSADQVRSEEFPHFITGQYGCGAPYCVYP